MSSGADLSSLVREAATYALRRTFFGDANDSTNKDNTARHKALVPSKEPIRVKQTDFDHAFSVVRPSVSKTERAKYSALSVKFCWGQPHMT